MTLNLNCCPNFNLGLGSLCSCKGKPETESPLPPTTPIGDEASSMYSLGEPITLIETEQIHFESLLPTHPEYLYLKILKNRVVLCATGGLMDDLQMIDKDFIGVDLCLIGKNTELFGGCICPLVSKTLDQGTAYQFCFKLGSSERLFCCSIYPCSIPGQISSADCVIRPVINGFRPSLIEKFVLPLQETGKRDGGWKTNIV